MKVIAEQLFRDVQLYHAGNLRCKYRHVSKYIFYTLVSLSLNVFYVLLIPFHIFIL